MARRKAPQNKAQPRAPENKEPPEDVQNGEDQMNESLEPDLARRLLNRLSRLLKAENTQWGHSTNRHELRRVADGIRQELRGDPFVEGMQDND